MKIRSLNEERSEVLKLIQEGRIEEAVKDKIVQTLSDRLQVRELPDFEMSAKGEEIFKSILRKNASADKEVASILICNVGMLKKSNGNYRVVLSYAAAFIILIVAGLFAYPWQTSEPNKMVKESSLTPEIIKVVNSGSYCAKVDSSRWKHCDP